MLGDRLLHGDDERRPERHGDFYAGDELSADSDKDGHRQRKYDQQSRWDKLRGHLQRPVRERGERDAYRTTRVEYCFRRLELYWHTELHLPVHGAELDRKYGWRSDRSGHVPIAALSREGRQAGRCSSLPQSRALVLAVQRKTQIQY